MEQLYGGLNIELMKRATEILRYLSTFGCLNRSYLDLMWEASQVIILLAVTSPFQGKA